MVADWVRIPETRSRKRKVSIDRQPFCWLEVIIATLLNSEI
jgi:hypothetical protein